MKTNTMIMRMSWVTLLILAALMLAGCGTSSNGSGSSGATSSTTVTYGFSNGYCYSNTGQIVAANYCGITSASYVNGSCVSNTGAVINAAYCGTTTTSGYTLLNGYCYANGTVVSTSYCSTLTTSTTATGYQCNGTYYYFSGYGYQPVQCAISNCRGYTLYEIAYQRWVTCQ